MRIAIVTGASSGLGREFVHQIGNFYQSLDEIWVIARREERLTALQGLTPVTIRVMRGDLLKKKIYKELEQTLSVEKPDIRMLVNAAGFGKSGKVEEILDEDKDAQSDMIRLNCLALSRVTFLCLPYMREGSRILNLSSAAAFLPESGFSVYSATKSYVLSFSRSLRQELKSKKIWVTAVCPGPVDTEFFDVAGSPSGSLREMTMASASAVVCQALLDSRDRKEISVYGAPMKLTRLACKLLPHRLLIQLEDTFLN